MIEILIEIVYAAHTSPISQWLEEYILNNEMLLYTLGTVIFIACYIFSVIEEKDRLYEDGLLFHIMPAFIASALISGCIYLAIYFHVLTIGLIFASLVLEILRALNNLTKKLFKPPEE